MSGRDVSGGGLSEAAQEDEPDTDWSGSSHSVQGHFCRRKWTCLFLIWLCSSSPSRTPCGRPLCEAREKLREVRKILAGRWFEFQMASSRSQLFTKWRRLRLSPISESCPLHATHSKVHHAHLGTTSLCEHHKMRAADHSIQFPVPRKVLEHRPEVEIGPRLVLGVFANSEEGCRGRARPE